MPFLPGFCFYLTCYYIFLLVNSVLHLRKFLMYENFTAFLFFGSSVPLLVLFPLCLYCFCLVAFHTYSLCFLFFNVCISLWRGRGRLVYSYYQVYDKESILCIVVLFLLNVCDLHPPSQIQTFSPSPCMFLVSQIIPEYARSLLVILLILV